MRMERKKTGGCQIRQSLPQNLTVTIMLLGEVGRKESD
jgi:hypothetical protein